MNMAEGFEGDSEINIHDSTLSLHGEIPKLPRHPGLEVNQITPEEPFVPEMTLEEFTERYGGKFSELTKAIRRNQYSGGVASHEFASILNEQIGKGLENNIPLAVMMDFLAQKKMHFGMRGFEYNLRRMFFVANRNGINTLGELREQKDSEYLHTGFKGMNKENSHRFLMEAIKPAPKEENP